ncbi:hypothetical protein DFH09DRAFT_137639 [Mycena vulgaris]|nr:hypothetical protein DFH09DRAFT_137639 [Mycena vulgaris]
MSDHVYNPYFEVAPASPPLAPNRAKNGGFSRQNTTELKTLPTLPMASVHGVDAPKLGYYPASLFILLVWLIFIILLVWLLESAVADGPTRLTHPWAYTTLPSLLITVFAQGHGAITAMHLARVSVSALHSPRTSPNTWAEVFWISDRAWQGPVGILSTVLAASRLRVRTSTHFILCAVTCLTALVTPIVLSRAYPIRSITVDEATTITPFSLSAAQMGAVDAYAEIGTGVGSWSTGLSVADVFNSSIYLPPGASRNDDPADFFFAGNTEGKTARLPGLRLTGQCVPVDSTVASFADFPAYCRAQIGDDLPTVTPLLNLVPVSVNFTMQACTNKTWESVFPTATSSLSTNVAYIYITSTNTSGTSSAGISVSGMIRCNSQMYTGMATLSGNGTYSSFSEAALYNATQAGEPLLDPLFALLYYFGSHSTSLDTDDIYRAAVIRPLGFFGISPGNGSQTYGQPSMQEMATGFWRGVSYTVAGIGLLARTNDTPYPAVQSGRAAVYVRERHFAAAAYALLAIWLLLVVVITARSFRPTFGGSFDSYITAKLVLDKPGMVHTSSGELSDNVKLREPFGRVGRDDFGRVVVAESPH